MSPLNENLKPSPEAALKELQDMMLKKGIKATTNALLGEVRKPVSSKATSKYSYYKERFALALKIIVDEMMAEHATGIYEDRMFSYEHYEGSLSHNSLYLKISQSKMFLLDHLDKESKYVKFFDLISITKERGKGIRLSYQRDVNGNPGGTAPFVALKVSQIPVKIEKPAWREKVDEFLEIGKPGDQLTINRGLDLSKNDIEALRVSLYP